MRVRISVKSLFDGPRVSVYRKQIQFGVRVNDERMVVELNFEDLFIAFIISDQIDFLFEVLKLYHETLGLCLHGHKSRVFPYLQEEVFHISIQIQPQGINIYELIPISLVIL
jgi:hypothetical protein